MSYFTNKNWNYSQYLNAERRAIISMGASPDVSGDTLLYFITVLDTLNNEIYQEEYNDLDMACQSINSKYGEFWEYKDLSFKDNSGGCSSCVAH